jgi:hypothetical protein
METYSLADVRRMASDEPQRFSLSEVIAMQKPEPTFNERMLARETNDLSSGLRRGARDVIDTGAEGLSWLYDKVTGADPATGEHARVKEMNRKAKEEWQAGTGSEILPHVQRIGGNILGTLPATSALGAGVSALGARGLGSAIGSGGMTAGGAGGGLANMATRIAGGAANGYVSAGLVDPSSANTGAVIGGLTPPVLQGLHSGARAVRDVARSAMTPAEVRAARDIAAVSGADIKSLDELAQLRAALQQQGPRQIPGDGPTVAQILQTPGASQLQRSIKAAAPTALAEREAAQNAARLQTLERIAPVSEGGLQQAADDVGNAISSFAIPAREQARQRVSAKFGAVDPFNESRINLPLSEMRAAKEQFLGPGTFGSGGSAQQAIREAEQIGELALPAIKGKTAGREPQNVIQAVRGLGGINPMSPGGMGREISELGRKQSGTTGLVSGKGKSIDKVAQVMHERGFIPDSDPSTLLNAIRGTMSGESHYAADVGDDAFRGVLERSMGDAPTATRISQPVNFNAIQNLRSSMGEAAQAASMQGNMREAAALQKMIRELDGRTAAVADGLGTTGEYFPSDMVATWKEALAAHKSKKLQFDTGPQARMFRRGGDGLPQIQGAEIPRSFFNNKVSQVEDAQSFLRLTKKDPALVGDLKRFAMTDAAGQTDSMGTLTNAKFNRWLDSRSGATGVLFNESERATLKAVADDLRRAASAESLGRSTGSDTAQKIASMTGLGLADSAGANLAASHFPAGRALLDFVRGPARAAKAERIGGLLGDPERLSELLGKYIGIQRPSPAGLLARAIDPLMYRSAPLLYSPASTGGGP